MKITEFTRIIGALVFAAGGTLLSKLYLDTSAGFGPSGDGPTVFSFLGFLLVGIGLSLIVRNGRT